MSTASPYTCEKPLTTFSSADEDYSGSLVILLENRGEEPVELRAGVSYVQIVPVKYFTGPVLGARDFTFRVERGDCGFGSTEERILQQERIQQLFAQTLSPSEPAIDGPRPDLEGDRVAQD